MTPLRIVHLLESFEIGGAELVALRLAAAQRAAGHLPLLVGFRAGPLLQRAKPHQLDCYVMHKSVRFDVALPFRLAALLRGEQADIVHSHNPLGLVYAAPAAKLAGVASVHTKHGEARAMGRRLRLLQIAARMVGRFVCVSNETRVYALSTGEAPAGRVDVIDNGVDTNAYRPDPTRRAVVREALGIAPAVVVIGTVGRLNKVKNQARLLRAAAPVLANERHLAEVHLLIAGDGPERGALEALAHNLGVAARVHFLGARADVEAVLNAMDVFVLSSDTEGLPLVILEAMASGLPVISTQVGAVASVVATAGRLVEVGNDSALYNEIGHLCNNSALREELGEVARERVVSHYSLKSMHEAYMTVYRALRRV
jgi:glycosyltransferase involved in cell wall biosynthesis